MTPAPQPPTAGAVLNNASEAAAHGIKILPADVTVRRQYEDLRALAADLLPRVNTPEALLQAADDLYWRAARLAAIAALPGTPSIDEQQQMRGLDLIRAAGRSAAAARAAGVQVTVELIAAAYDMSDDLAARSLRQAWAGG